MAVFALLDLDDSQELEEHEIMDVLMNRQLLGQDREKQVKQDAKDWFEK